MAIMVANKSQQGISHIFESTDTPIQTYDQAESNTKNATERTGTTIAPVPANKQLVITSITCLISRTGFDMSIYDSPNSASTAGATQIGQIIGTASDGWWSMPVYYKIAAGRYFVIAEGGGGKAQVYFQGYLEDV